eukprot:m51a1_g457 hypothetical protein (971) ;mRNA; f:152933-157739
MAGEDRRDSYGFEVVPSDAPTTPDEARERSNSWLALALSLAAPASEAEPCQQRPASPTSSTPQAAGPASGVDEESRLQIEADLPRTLPACRAVSGSAEAKCALRRLLHRFTAEHPDLGYTQSLSDVAAVALVGVSAGRTEQLGGEEGARASSLHVERAAYAVVDEVAAALGDDFYAPTLAGVQVESRVLETLAQRRLPAVSRALVEGGAMFLPTVARWLLCVFAQDLPPRPLFALWDRLLADLGRPSDGSAAGGRAAARSRFVSRLHGMCLAVLEAVPRVPLERGLGMIGALRDAPRFAAAEGSASLLERADRYARDLVENAGEVEQLRQAARKEVQEEAERVNSLALVRQLERQTQFKRAELDALLREFRAIGGKIDREAFRGVIERSAPEWTGDRAVVDSLFGSFDTDSNGTLDFKEVTLGLSVLCRGTLRDKLGAVFRAIDADRSGGLSREELLGLLRGTGLFDRLSRGRGGALRIGIAHRAQSAEEYADRLFANLDTDHNGVVSAEEFEKVVAVEPAFIRLFFADRRHSRLEMSDVLQRLHESGSADEAKPLCHAQRRAALFQFLSPDSQAYVRRCSARAKRSSSSSVSSSASAGSSGRPLGIATPPNRPPTAALASARALALQRAEQREAEQQASLRAGAEQEEKERVLEAAKDSLRGSWLQHKARAEEERRRRRAEQERAEQQARERDKDRDRPRQDTLSDTVAPGLWFSYSEEVASLAKERQQAEEDMRSVSSQLEEAQAHTKQLDDLLSVLRISRDTDISRIEEARGLVPSSAVADRLGQEERAFHRANSRVDQRNTEHEAARGKILEDIAEAQRDMKALKYQIELALTQKEADEAEFQAIVEEQDRSVAYLAELNKSIIKSEEDSLQLLLDLKNDGIATERKIATMEVEEKILLERNVKMEEKIKLVRQTIAQLARQISYSSEEQAAVNKKSQLQGSTPPQATIMTIRSRHNMISATEPPL